MIRNPFFPVLTAVAILSMCLPSLPAAAEETTPATPAPSAVNMLPAVLHDASGKEVETETLREKFVGLYFSAHWCPPCRAFTPSLVKFRDEHADKDFEIVFVSLDNSKRDKRKYIKQMDMKWLSIPGAQSKEADALAQQFEIRGIPSLIILAPDGSVVTPHGREDVMMSPETALSKWKEKAKNPS
ncbi:MAG: redoxin family protein [Verrucomicrobiaceae bacterium]|nr:redoxin family protein [Verrucomicrobiaceae bacterium]